MDSKQIKLSGNRCGHIPEAPQLYIRPKEQKKTYSSIHIATERLEEYYYQPVNNWLPNLHLRRKTLRQQRSERREAVLALASVMVNHVDMATMRVVRLFNNKLVELSIKELAAKAHIHLRRAERALKDLKEAGYIDLQYRVEHCADGTIKPKIAIKRLSALFFYHLGVSFEKLKKEGDRAKKHLAKFSKHARMKASEFKGASTSFFKSFGNRPLFKRPAKANSDITQNKRRAEFAYTLKINHPDWGIDKIKQELDKQSTQ